MKLRNIWQRRGSNIDSIFRWFPLFHHRLIHEHQHQTWHPNRRRDIWCNQSIFWQPWDSIFWWFPLVHHRLIHEHQHQTWHPNQRWDRWCDQSIFWQPWGNPISNGPSWIDLINHIRLTFVSCILWYVSSRSASS